MNSVENKNCSGCGNSFTCGAEASDERCWCDSLPHLPLTAIESRDCFCPGCLREAIQRVKPSPSVVEEHLRSATTSVGPQGLLVEGEDYYSEGGAIVFTAHYHLRRGYCCDSGCRHCPYI